MQIFLLLVIVITNINYLYSLEPIKETWSDYKEKYDKEYGSRKEELKRRAVFKNNLRKIANNNAEYGLGKTFKMGVNKYSDLTNREFNRLLNGYGEGLQLVTKKTFVAPVKLQTAPTLDWRTLGAVSPVGDQGWCGSCWAFSATGALEGQWFRKTGILYQISEQNLIDCTYSYGNDGCNGGVMGNAFQYVKDNNGVNMDATYLYEGVDNVCRYNASKPKVTATSYVSIESGNENKLLQALILFGPISVAMDASLVSFQGYASGVYSDSNCNPQYLNHAMLVVGYGTTSNNIDYWILKNSWGTSWGELGYMKIARNQSSMCGIATAAVYPIV